MTRKTASELGLDPHYKVRISMRGGGMIHLASWDEPHRAMAENWTAQWIDDHRYGDTKGYIDWSEVVAVTWRWSE